MIALHPDFAGRMLGRYQLDKQIAKGSASAIYLGHDPDNSYMPVAIKVLWLIEGDQTGMVARAEYELAAVQRLKLEHPNIVQTFGYGRGEDYVYIVMRYIPTGSLHDRMRGEPFAPGVAVYYAEQICAALVYAHGKGIIHRDVKPANILMDRWLVLLADFGIAKIWENPGVTVVGTTVGTPEYIAPEQALADPDQPIDERCDIYSLGCLLYHMLSGIPPFKGKTGLSLMYQHVHLEPPDLQGICPAVTDGLAAVVHKAMAKRREDRYPSAMAMGVHLHQLKG